MKQDYTTQCIPSSSEGGVKIPPGFRFQALNPNSRTPRQATGAIVGVTLFLTPIPLPMIAGGSSTTQAARPGIYPVARAIVLW
jgi:hypothetical protein